MIDPLREKQADLDKLHAVMQRAAQAAIAEHHRRGFAVPVWRDGRVVWLGPTGEVTLSNPGQLPNSADRQSATNN